MYSQKPPFYIAKGCFLRFYSFSLSLAFLSLVSVGHLTNLPLAWIEKGLPSARKNCFRQNKPYKYLADMSDESATPFHVGCIYKHMFTGKYTHTHKKESACIDNVHIFNKLLFFFVVGLLVITDVTQNKVLTLRDLAHTNGKRPRSSYKSKPPFL